MNLTNPDPGNYCRNKRYMPQKPIFGKILLALGFILISSCSENEAEKTVKTDQIKYDTSIKQNMKTSVVSTPENKVNKEDFKKHRVNELGMVMVLEYHKIAKPEERWTRTPENFKKDLEKLYKAGFYLTPLRDFVNNKINVPLGKTPVILTFDDGSEGQFRYLKNGSQSVIDPQSAIGILEDFSKKHTDFGKAATFYVLPRLAFGQTTADANNKLKFLAANGYEIGNHTLDHTGLNTVNDDKVKAAIGEHVIAVQKILPDYQVNTLAYPYGGVPKNLKIVEKGEYKGTKYQNIAALLVGAEPSLSPASKKFKPLLIPRIQAIQSELDRYFLLFKNNPEYKYISDGNPDTITIPGKLAKVFENSLRDDLQSKYKVIRY